MPKIVLIMCIFLLSGCLEKTTILKNSQIENEKQAKIEIEQKAKKQEIQQKVTSHFVKLSKSDNNQLLCKISVRLASNGEVIQISIVQSSGDQNFNNSAMLAVQKSSPLPVPSHKEIFEKYFQSLDLVFFPKNSSSDEKTKENGDSSSYPAKALAENIEGIVPLVRVPPRYPLKALKEHIEGRVTLEFTVATDGSIKNAVVLKAMPKEIFDAAALSAIKQWKFKPKIINRIAVEQQSIQTIKFEIKTGQEVYIGY